MVPQRRNNKRGGGVWVLLYFRSGFVIPTAKPPTCERASPVFFPFTRHVGAGGRGRWESSPARHEEASGGPGAFCWKRTPEIKRKAPPSPGNAEEKKMEQNKNDNEAGSLPPISKHIHYLRDMVLFIIKFAQMHKMSHINPDFFFFF